MYRSIVQAMARDIRRGTLKPQERLPTHRDLADEMGVTVGTITRAYRLAQQRGLVRGEVGRGTYVAEPGQTGLPQHNPPDVFSDEVDLRLNIPPYGEDPDLGGVLSEMAGEGALGDLLKYQPASGMERHRRAGVDWLAFCGLRADPSEVLVCAGSQHALLVALTAVTRPGDTILTESLTYPGFKALAGVLGLRLEPVGMDEEGLVPEDLEAACRRSGARVLYCMPTLHNPVNTTLSPERRQQVAELAETHDLTVIEDDVHGLLPPDPPRPIRAILPERTIYIPGLSKILAGGLRVTFMAAPAHLQEDLARGIAATMWMAAPLTAEIAARWIADGTAVRTIEKKRAEAMARQELAGEILGQWLDRPFLYSYHLWLSPPPPWRSSHFAAECRQAGVSVLPAEVFMVGQAGAPQAVRVSLSAAADRAVLAKGLRRLADLMERSPRQDLFVL